MIGAHLLLLFSVAGRFFAVDGVRSGAASGRTLATVWGWIAIAVGAYSVLGSFGDPLAARGPGLRSSDLSMSLGDYNLLGGLVLLVVGLLLLASSRAPGRGLGVGAAALAVLAAGVAARPDRFQRPAPGGQRDGRRGLLLAGPRGARHRPRRQPHARPGSPYGSPPGGISVTLPAASRRCVLLGVGAGFLLTSCGGESGGTSGSGPAPTLGISAIPDQDPELLNRLYPAVADRFAEGTGLEVAYRPVTDYTAVVRAFEVGDIHLAWMGGLTGVQARFRVDGATAIAQRDIDAEFHSLFIANTAPGSIRSTTPRACSPWPGTA